MKISRILNPSGSPSLPSWLAEAGESSCGDYQSQPLLLIAPIKWSESCRADTAAGLNVILADVFALFRKTHGFHSRLGVAHFRDYHLLLDEHEDALDAMMSPVVERIGGAGGAAGRLIGDTAPISNKDSEYLDPVDMLAELREDNLDLAARLREVSWMLDAHSDIGTAILIESWIGETERRISNLLESDRRLRDSMSCPTLPLLLPTAPITVPSRFTGMPPPKMTTLESFVVLMPNPCCPICAKWERSSVDMSNVRAVQALLIAISTLPSHAPSIRTSATRPPPTSATAMLYGTPISIALRSPAAIIFLALARSKDNAGLLIRISWFDYVLDVSTSVPERR